MGMTEWCMVYMGMSEICVKLPTSLHRIRLNFICSLQLLQAITTVSEVISAK